MKCNNSSRSINFLRSQLLAQQILILSKKKKHANYERDHRADRVKLDFGWYAMLGLNAHGLRHINQVWPQLNTHVKLK